jgi:hypothetical protein
VALNTWAICVRPIQTRINKFKNGGLGVRPEEIITLDDYQVEAHRTRKAVYGPIPAIMIDALGLAGESGEFADDIKKV